MYRGVSILTDPLTKEGYSYLRIVNTIKYDNERNKQKRARR